MEELGWSVGVSACEGKDYEEWELGQYSPAGEDFYISFTTDLDDPYDVEREVRAWHCGFDPEEHAAMWLEARIRNSCAGVPDMFTLVHDAEAIDEMLDELSDAVTEIVRGKPETIQETFAKSFALRPMLEEAMKDIPMSQRMHPVNWEKACAVLADYHGSKGSVMDFTEDDWKVWQKYQGHPFDPEETVDDVCIICDEPHMSPIIEFEACVAKACYRWHEDMTAYHQTDAERDAGLPPIEYIQDCVANIYKWRMELLTKAIAAIKDEMEANRNEGSV